MSEINLDDGTIKVDGEWLSAEQISEQIQEKMQSGDMKFSALASALETLKTAMEDTRTLEIKLVLPEKDYEKLLAAGGTQDERQCIRKAVEAFIRDPEPAAKTGMAPAPGASRKHPSVRCARCGCRIEITSTRRPLEVECPECGTTGVVKAAAKTESRQDEPSAD